MTAAVKSLNCVLTAMKEPCVISPQSSSEVTIQKIASMKDIVRLVLSFAAESTINSVLEYAKKIFPYISTSMLVNNGTSSYKFWCNIIGKDVRSMRNNNNCDLSIQVLFQHLEICERQIKARLVHKATLDDSLLWFKNNKKEQMVKLLQISSCFPRYFDCYLKKHFEDKTLDEIALTKMFWQKPSKRQCKSKATTVGEGMKFEVLHVKEPKTGELHGTAFTISNALSLQFMEKFSKQDQRTYDLWKKKDKDTGKEHLDLALYRLRIKKVFGSKLERPRVVIYTLLMKQRLWRISFYK